MREILLDFLDHGEEHAKTSGQIAAYMGLEPRDTCELVNRMRKDGVQILSSGAGYFLPANEEEITRFVASMRSRARDILQAASGVERGGGQE